MGVDHGRTGGRPPRIWSGGSSHQILSCCKILSTTLLALQCRKMCFLPLQQDFYSNSRHASPPEFQSDLRLCVHGQRGRGRPKKRWLDVVRSDCADMGLTVHDAIHRAQDRDDAWRRSIAKLPLRAPAGVSPRH